MNQPDDVLAPGSDTAPPTPQEIERLWRLTVYGRWFVVALLWLTVGALSLWGLRESIGLMLDYFTWAALRYGLAFHRLSAIGLAICIGITVAVLLWQSRISVFGLSRRDQRWLEQQVQCIRTQGPSHPLWRFVCNAQPNQKR